MRRTLTLILTFATLTTISACETTKGFVRDVQNVGDALVGN